MSGEVIRHPASTRDIDAIAVFIADCNAEAAFRFLEAIESTYRILAEMPEAGVAREYGNPELCGLRMFPVRDFPNHLIFYRPVAVGIEVLRVLHASRDIEALFRPR